MSKVQNIDWTKCRRDKWANEQIFSVNKKSKGQKCETNKDANRQIVEDKISDTYFDNDNIY